MNESSEKLTKAINLHQEGSPELAIPVYREHLACQPEDGQVVYLLGTALLQLGNGSEAIDYLEQAEKKFPHIPDISNNTEIAYQSIGDWEKAEASFKRSIKINPDYGQAYFNYGSLLYDRNRFEEAESHLIQAVRLSPGDCEVMGKYADILKAQKKWIEASKSYHSMIQLPQVSLDSLVNYAFVLVQLNRLDEAIEVYAQVLNRKPDYYQVFNSLGYLLERQGKLYDALSLVERSLLINSEYAEAWNNKGVIQKSLYQFDDAKKSFEKALEIQPEFSLAHYNLGTNYLIQEQYQEGWNGFSHHSKLNQAEDPHNNIPEWNGESIPQKKLLVYVDQGLGDALMMIRFLDLLKEKSEANLTIECPKPLLKLFRNSFPDYEFNEEGDGNSKFDFRIALSQSPVVLDLRIEDLSLKKPYISVSKSDNIPLLKLLDKQENTKKKIGLCWQGNQDQSRDHVRSCPLLLLETLLDQPTVQWYSFQVDEVSRRLLDEAGLSEKILDLGGSFGSFCDTAFAMSKMDLIITVDTSIAHLAGAIQVPVWTMLCHLPDWRWHLHRADSPWYPGMKLFRQPQWGDWNNLIIDLKESLQNKFS